MGLDSTPRGRGVDREPRASAQSSPPSAAAAGPRSSSLTSITTITALKATDITLVEPLEVVATPERWKAAEIKPTKADIDAEPTNNEHA
jgi:hypothetical protein